MEEFGGVPVLSNTPFSPYFTRGNNIGLNTTGQSSTMCFFKDYLFICFCYSIFIFVSLHCCLFNVSLRLTAIAHNLRQINACGRFVMVLQAYTARY